MSGRRLLRSAGGVLAGYAVVGLGLSFIVVAWWIEGWLPLGTLGIAAIVAALCLVGGLAGWVASTIDGSESSVAVLGVAVLTTLVLVANIVMDVAIEPLWFKLLAIGSIVPIVLLVGRRKRQPKD